MNETVIHPTAIVSAKAKVGTGVSIGPYCCIGDDAQIGDGCVLDSHVVINGRVTIGANTRIYPFCVLGSPPQDNKYQNEPTTVAIGSNCTLREHVTVHRGTMDREETRVGDGCMLMVGSHVAHDCWLGEGVTLINNVSLAGHVTIEDRAIIGGLTGIHQFVRIGTHAMVGGLCRVARDVLPYTLISQANAEVAGINLVGLRRRGFTKSDITQLRSAVESLKSPDQTVATTLEDLRAGAASGSPLEAMVDFAALAGRRGLTL